jgi:hypothetical protein
MQLATKSLTSFRALKKAPLFNLNTMCAKSTVSVELGDVFTTHCKF